MRDEAGGEWPDSFPSISDNPNELGLGTIIISAIRDENITVTVEVHSQPPAEPHADWTMIIEGTVDFPTGKIEVVGMGDPGEGKTFQIEPDIYHVCAYNLPTEKLNETIEVEGRIFSLEVNHYRIILWPCLEK